MINVNAVILENGFEYLEIDELIYNNIRYILLSNVNNAKDSCIRKIVIKDNLEYICGLDTDDEYEIVLNMFINKNKTLFS